MAGALGLKREAADSSTEPGAVLQKLVESLTDDGVIKR